MTTALRDLIKNPTAAELELVARYAMLPEDPRRERAFTAFAASGLPHRRMEAWKWTDFKASLNEVEAIRAPLESDPFAPLEAARFQFDGTGVTVPALPSGIRVIERPEPVAVEGAEDMPLAAMTAALAGSKDFSMLLIEVAEPVAPAATFCLRWRRPRACFSARENRHSRKCRVEPG